MTRYTYKITPRLCPGAFGLPGPAVEAPSFSVVAESELAACEVAFAVCNSYPEELHCDRSLRPYVVLYRARRHRSLSVGDEVVVGSNTYRCTRGGWEPAR